MTGPTNSPARRGLIDCPVPAAAGGPSVRPVPSPEPPSGRSGRPGSWLLHLLVWGILPNLPFWIAGQAFLIARASYNLDYLAIGALMAPSWRRRGVRAWACCSSSAP